MAEQKSEIRSMVRLMATDINGNLKIANALRRIRGISFMFSHAICTSEGISPSAKIGSLSDSELKTLEGAIKNQATEANLPQWLLNRRNDPETGKGMHLTGTQIELVKRDDINTMRRIRSYRGIRHQMGLPVRGQRTRSSFRKSKKAVGVMKKAARQQARPVQEKNEGKK